MAFKLLFSSEAKQQLKELGEDPSREKRLKAVRKTLGLLEGGNVRHPSLNTHKYEALKGPNGVDAFEAYAENNRPAAYRVFFSYGPDKGQMTIISITEHP